MAGKIVSRGGGIGDSRIFVDPDAEPIDHLAPLVGLHFNGIAAEDIEESALKYLTPQLSDEHQVTLTPHIEVRDRGGRARVTATEVDKQIAERGEFLEDYEDTFLAPDARKDLADRHVGPGMRAKFINPNKLSKTGRDARGFEIVKDERGEPVMHGVSVLGQMPEARAEARNKHYRKLGNEQLEHVYAKAAAPDGKEARFLEPKDMVEAKNR